MPQGPAVTLPLEFTCPTKSLSALLFWGVSRQFSRPKASRTHCGQVLLDMLHGLVQSIADLTLRIPSFFAQPGCIVGPDGAFWEVDVSNGHVSLQHVWASIPADERSTSEVKL